MDLKKHANGRVIGVEEENFRKKIYNISVFGALKR